MPESVDNFHETWCAYYATVSPHLHTLLISNHL